MIAALEGAPGVGKSTLAAGLARGATVVPEINQLFLRPRPEPADWYLDRQNARWEIAAHAERSGRTAVLDGDPLQPLWLGWLYPNENWTPSATAASFFIDRIQSGRMRLPDRYLFLVVDEAERGHRLRNREVARGLGAGRAAEKVRRYSTFAASQHRFFAALSERFPGWIMTLDTGTPDAAVQAAALLEACASPPDGVMAVTYAADWLATHVCASDEGGTE